MLEDENQTVQRPGHAADRAKHQQEGSCSKQAIEVTPEKNSGQDRSGKFEAQSAISAVDEKGGRARHTDMSELSTPVNNSITSYVVISFPTVFTGFSTYLRPSFRSARFAA